MFAVRGSVGERNVHFFDLLPFRIGRGGSRAFFARGGAHARFTRVFIAAAAEKAPRGAGNAAFIWIVDIRRHGKEKQSVLFGAIFLV